MTTFIPENTVTTADVGLWYQAKQELGVIQTRERLLRDRIYGHFFQNPKEGVNKAEMPEKWLLNATRVVSRTVDDAAVKLYAAKFEEAGIAVASLIKYKPELVTAEYRKLSDEQRALFDNCLTIKDGSPQLELKPPKGWTK